eukprot:scaffold180_cov311-Pinguiococcus_pyrenoidosus.AAC.17
MSCTSQRSTDDLGKLASSANEAATRPSTEGFSEVAADVNCGSVDDCRGLPAQEHGSRTAEEDTSPRGGDSPMGIAIVHNAHPSAWSTREAANALDEDFQTIWRDLAVMMAELCADFEDEASAKK